MNGARIEITVDKAGNATTHVFGVTGESCRVASRPFEELFGSVLTSKATEEAYERPEEVNIDVNTDL